jgi:hypothetical protein
MEFVLCSFLPTLGRSIAPLGHDGNISPAAWRCQIERWPWNEMFERRAFLTQAPDSL